MSGLSNAKLRELGGRLKFRAGLPQFFDELRGIVSERAERDNLDVSLEHYIISTGIAEMIRGSSIAGHVDGIFGCEFVEEPLPPYFSRQPEFDLADLSHQITQIGMIVDNTIKTRFVFEINKGTNKIRGTTRIQEHITVFSLKTSDKVPTDNAVLRFALHI